LANFQNASEHVSPSVRKASAIDNNGRGKVRGEREEGEKEEKIRKRRR